MNTYSNRAQDGSLKTLPANHEGIVREPCWQEAPLPELEAVGGVRRRWLVSVVAGEGLEWTTALRAAGVDAFLVAPDECGATLRQALASGDRVGLLIIAGAAASQDTGGDLTDEPTRLCEAFLRLVRPLAGVSQSADVGLALITTGKRVVPGDSPGLPATGALWSLLGTVAREQPRLRAVRLDVARAPTTACFAAFASALRDVPAGLTSRAIRAGRTYRLALDAPPAEARVRARGRTLPQTSPRAAGDRWFTVRRGHGGAIELRAEPLRRVLPGEVAVELSSGSLDPLAGGHGSEPPVDGNIGWGGTGRLIAVGEGVRGGLRVGQRVVVMSDGIGRFVQTNAALVAALPNDLDEVEAAGRIPSLVLALHVLHDVARARAGDQVLVMGAASPFGLALIRLARRLGAGVVAEEPSASGRRWLASHGVPRALDATRSSFLEELMQMPRGNRVTLIVGQAGRPLPDPEPFTAAGAHYVQIGETEDAAADGRLPFARVAVSRVVPGVLLRAHPEALSPNLRLAITLARGLDLPSAEPISLQKASVDAIRLGDGPVPVLSFDGAAAAPISAAAESVANVRTDGAYLVAGGTGALGAEVAKWLVRKGAGCVILASRREPDVNCRVAMDLMRRSGARVEWVRADLSLPQDARRALEADYSPFCLRGVAVATAARASAPTHEIDSTKLAEAFASKLAVTSTLLQATDGMALDFFILLTGLAQGSPRAGAMLAADDAAAALVRAFERSGDEGNTLRFHIAVAPVRMPTSLGVPGRTEWWPGAVSAENACDALDEVLAAERLDAAIAAEPLGVDLDAILAPVEVPVPERAQSKPSERRNLTVIA